LVRVIRPVFEAAVVEVEAQDENEATDKAICQACAIPKEEWKGRFDPYQYFYDAHCLRDEKSKEGHPFTSLDNYPKYCLLQADLDLDAGKVVCQPWMNAIAPLLIAAVCSDWSLDLKTIRNEGFEEAFEPIDKLLELLESKHAKVIPFAPPAERLRDVKILKTIQDKIQDWKDED
jgi:hypothetical protein